MSCIDKKRKERGKRDGSRGKDDGSEAVQYEQIAWEEINQYLPLISLGIALFTLFITATK